MIDYATLDPECQHLCRVLNSITPAVQTIESCSGHGVAPLRIWLRVDDLTALPSVLYWLDACHTGERGWRCTVYTSCAADTVRWMIEGPADTANQLAAVISSSLLQRHRQPGLPGRELPVPLSDTYAAAPDGGR